MNIVWLKSVEYIATFWEISLAYVFCSRMLDVKLSVIKRVGFTLLLTVLIQYCNTLALFSPVTSGLVTCLLGITVSINARGRIVGSFFYSYFYILFVYIFDFLAASLFGLLLGERNLAGEVAYSLSIERCLFLILSKSLLTAAIYATLYLVKRLKTIGFRQMLIITVIGSALGGYFTTLTFEDITIERTVSWLLIFFLVIFLYTSFALYQQYLLENAELKVIHMRNELVSQQYAELLREYQENAKIHHDSLNHLSLIQNLLLEKKYQEAKQYLEEILQDISFSSITWSGNETIDYILNRKKKLAEASHIQFDIASDLLPELPVKASVLNIVFSNLLDNAIEACQKIKSVKPKIEVSVRRVHSMIVIMVENSVDTIPISRNGVWRTTKADKRLHGWGLKSVKSAVESCGGSMVYMEGDRTFKVVVTFFISKKDMDG